jgi:hypothetical protein
MTKTNSNYASIMFDALLLKTCLHGVYLFFFWNTLFCNIVVLPGKLMTRA